jgi:hypothetical protein
LVHLLMFNDTSWLPLMARPFFFQFCSSFFDVISGWSLSHPVVSLLARLWCCFQLFPPTHSSLVHLPFNDPSPLPLMSRPIFFQFHCSFFNVISGPSFSHPVVSLLAPL